MEKKYQKYQKYGRSTRRLGLGTLIRQRDSWVWGPSHSSASGSP